MILSGGLITDALAGGGGTGGGGKAKEKTITENGSYAITDEEKAEGYLGYSPVNVSVQPKLTSLTATKNGTYDAPAGYDGFGSVTVAVASSIGGEYTYEDDDVIVSAYDYYNIALKYTPSIENNYYIPRMNIEVKVIFKYANTTKGTAFAYQYVDILSKEFTVSNELPEGLYKILSISAWKISDIHTSKITNEDNSKYFKIEVSITCEASGVAEDVGGFTYRGTQTITNSDWLLDENA